MVDFAGPLDPGSFTGKSLSLHTEMVFSKITAGGDVGSQGRILVRTAQEVAASRLRPIATKRCTG